MSEMKCPVTGRSINVTSERSNINNDFWPNQLDLSILHQNSNLSNPWDLSLIILRSFVNLTTLH